MGRLCEICEVGTPVLMQGIGYPALECRTCGYSWSVCAVPRVDVTFHGDVAVISGHVAFRRKDTDPEGLAKARAEYRSRVPQVSRCIKCNRTNEHAPWYLDQGGYDDAPF